MERLSLEKMQEILTFSVVFSDDEVRYFVCICLLQTCRFHGESGTGFYLLNCLIFGEIFIKKGGNHGKTERVQ